MIAGVSLAAGVSLESCCGCVFILLDDGACVKAEIEFRLQTRWFEKIAHRARPCRPP